MPEDQICVKMMLRYLKKHGVDGVDDVDGFLSWLSNCELDKDKPCGRKVRAKKRDREEEEDNCKKKRQTAAHLLP